MHSISIAESTVRKIVDKAVTKRYNVTLQEFVDACHNGTVVKFPQSEDLVELVKYFDR